MNKNGFTLVELLVVIAILGVLAAIVLLAINPLEIIKKARYNRTKQDLQSIARATQIFAADNGYYPDDVWRDIPTELIKYLNPGSWPKGPFPGSVYDYDNWLDRTCWDGSTGIIQITLRQVKGWKEGSDDWTIYYVIEGPGIPHCHQSDVRGECTNCESRYLE